MKALGVQMMSIEKSALTKAVVLALSSTLPEGTYRDAAAEVHCFSGDLFDFS